MNKHRTKINKTIMGESECHSLMGFSIKSIKQFIESQKFKVWIPEENTASYRNFRPYPLFDKYIP